jgi:HTH-type transcriptional regulator/antitoxin HigA
MHVISFKILIEKFEQEYYQPNQQNNPKSMLLFLLEQSDKTKADLQAVLGSETLVDDILNGNQKINPELAQKLADFFMWKQIYFMNRINL